MKKKIEKLKTKVKNKILQVLRKMVEVATLLAFMLLELLIFTLIGHNKASYRYVDMEGNIGQSKSCYYNDIDREIQCEIPTKVNQYEKRK